MKRGFPEVGFDNETDFMGDVWGFEETFEENERDVKDDVRDDIETAIAIGGREELCWF